MLDNIAIDIARPSSGVSSSSRPRNSRSVTVISADLTIFGNVVSRGEVQVDGEIQGDIHALNIVVGENSKVTGGVVANEVVVRGAVLGSIRGNHVMLQATSHVEGDVFHQQLSIEQGSYFEGKSRRVEDPTSVELERPVPGRPIA